MICPGASWQRRSIASVTGLTDVVSTAFTITLLP